MEPVHGGRDDGEDTIEGYIVGVQPQWSPSTEDGTTAYRYADKWVIDGPQWSPSTEDGTT